MGIRVLNQKPTQLEALANKVSSGADSSTLQNVKIKFPIPDWKEILDYFDSEEADLSPSTYTRALYIIIDSEVSGRRIPNSPSSADYFVSSVFLKNFLGISLKEKHFISLLYSIFNMPVLDENWRTVRELLKEEVESQGSRKLKKLVEAFDGLDQRIVDEILKSDLKKKPLNIKNSIKQSSPIFLKNLHLDKMVERIRNEIAKRMWDQNIRVSKRNFDVIFGFYSRPTSLFEESVIKLLELKKVGSNQSFVNDFFEYLKDKWEIGINPEDYKLINEKHYALYQKLAGEHTFNTVLSAKDDIYRYLEDHWDDDMWKKARSRIQFWEIYKGYTHGMRIFFPKDLVSNNAKLRNRNDIRVSESFPLFILKFEDFYFVQFLEKAGYLTLGSYFPIDDKNIENIFNAKVFNRAHAMDIQSFAERKTKHDWGWQYVVSQFLLTEHGLQVPKKFKHLKYLQPGDDHRDRFE